MKSDLLLLQSILHPRASRAPPRLCRAGRYLGTVERHRNYTVTACRRQRRPWQELPKRVIPTYHGRQHHSSHHLVVILNPANHAKHKQTRKRPTWSP